MRTVLIVFRLQYSDETFRGCASIKLVGTKSIVPECSKRTALNCKDIESVGKVTDRDGIPNSPTEGLVLCS